MEGEPANADPGHAALKTANLDRLMQAAKALWPSHAKFLRSSLAGYDEGDLGLVEDLATRVCLLAGEDLETYIASYRWMCREMNKEALHFKKYGAYRLSSFEEAFSEVYSNSDFMRKYMEGLLVSQVFWRNHSAAFIYFQKKFLPRLTDGYQYLEVGPGHGLFLSVAAERAQCAKATGWDVSEESLRQTAQALEKLGLAGRVVLDQQDIHAPTRSPDEIPKLDGIAICEVLEHLERPGDALGSLRRYLKPDGAMFINVPINSPAPDHIYLLRNEGEVRDLVQSSGLEILDLQLAPMTGYSLKEAESQKATINCFVLAR